MSEKHSKEFFELIRSIGESKSKMEEDAIIEDEVARLKAVLSSRDIKPVSRSVCVSSLVSLSPSPERFFLLVARRGVRRST